LSGEGLPPLTPDGASQPSHTAPNKGTPEGTVPSSTPALPTKLEAFVRARPEPTSIAFISWLADLEAGAPQGPEKVQLGVLCGWLVALRDLMEREAQEEVYAATLAALSSEYAVH